MIVVSYYQNYCVECGWEASKKNNSRSELASLAIDHAVSTGHDIDSRNVSEGSDSDFESEIEGGVGAKTSALSDTQNTRE